MRHSFPHWPFWLKLSFLKLSFILIIISSYEVSIIPQKAKESVDCKKRLEWLHFSQFWQGLWWMHVFPHMLCYVLCYIVRTHLFSWETMISPFSLFSFIAHFNVNIQPQHCSFPMINLCLFFSMEVCFY